MKGFNLLKKNRRAGITLVEMIVSAMLMVSLVAMAAGAVAPGVRLVLKMQDMYKSQQVMDALLEDITHQISTAASDVRVNRTGEYIDFKIADNDSISISSEGYTPPALVGGLQPIAAGVPYYRHYNARTDKKVVKPFPDGFYAGRFVKISFEHKESEQLVTVNIDMFSDAARTQKVLSGTGVAKYKPPIYTSLTQVERGRVYKASFEPAAYTYKILKADIHGMVEAAPGSSTKVDKIMRDVTISDKQLTIVGTALTDAQLFDWWLILRVEVTGDESASPRFIRVNLSEVW